jgi:hypothetical protein
VVDDQRVAAGPVLSPDHRRYLLLRQPVNLVIGVERPMLRRFVTVIGALVACRLWLSLPN